MRAPIALTALIALAASAAAQQPAAADPRAQMAALQFPPLRFNPLAVAKRDPDIHVSGLFEALHMTQATESATQHRQMRRFVTATLHALIENDLTLMQVAREMNEHDLAHLWQLRRLCDRLETASV